MCAERGLEGRPKDGNTDATPLLYISMWEIADSKLDAIKLSNAKISVVFIFMPWGVVQNIQKFALIQYFLLYGTFVRDILLQNPKPSAKASVNVRTCMVWIKEILIYN